MLRFYVNALIIDQLLNKKKIKKSAQPQSKVRQPWEVLLPFGEHLMFWLPFTQYSCPWGITIFIWLCWAINNMQSWHLLQLTLLTITIHSQLLKKKILKFNSSSIALLTMCISECCHNRVLYWVYTDPYCVLFRS